MERDRPTLSPVVAVAAVVVLAVLFGGLWVVVATGDAEPIGLDAGERYAAVDATRATEVTVVERGGETSRTVAEVLRRPGTEHRRIELVGRTDRRYDLTVANGSTLWLYDDDRSLAKRIPLSGGTGPTTGDRIERLFAQLNVTPGHGPATVTADPGVSPLPVVPRGGGPPAPPATDGPYRIRYDGTATVDGRETHVVSVAARLGSDAFRQTLWVDTEHFYPLRERTAWTAGGERVVRTTTVRDVTFDPDPPVAPFRFDPPPSTTIEVVDAPRTTTYDSVAALRTDTDVAVPDPAVPPSFGLTYASQTTGRIHGVGLRYVNGTSRLTVATYNRTVETEGDRQVTVAGRPAQLSVGATLSLSWNCGAYRYTVRGEGVSADRLVGVARSVGCSGTTG
jgi:outer membrane lipoprotein-sorting protein